MRQNTGNPNTAADSSEPPRMTWRESSAARFSAQEEQPAFEPQPFKAACSSAESGAGSAAASVPAPAPSATAAFTSGFSLAGSTPVPVMSVFEVFFEKMPRIFDTTGTGHTQPQKARANSRMRAMAMTTEMTARGIMVLVAIMVISAPRGQSSEMSCQPMADRVPTPTWVANPTATTAMTARGMIVRSRLVFTALASFRLRGDGRRWRARWPRRKWSRSATRRTRSRRRRSRCTRRSARRGGLFSSSAMASYSQAS